MILKELNLIGFGKFENKKLALKDGINLIYGENEAGKSTIHSFVDGMFYGFLKPNAKTTSYIDEHKKYDPWSSGRYAGVIRFEHEGKLYRIEREFKRGRENTKILEENTGVDITKDLDVGKGRILQPGIHFFGFNTRVFSNTIFIKQLGTQTDDKLANEVTEKLINVTTALDDDISVDNAITELRIAMADIGTDRAHTRPYAKTIECIDMLKDEKIKILLEKERYESYLDGKSKLLDILDVEETIYKSLMNTVSRAKAIQKKKILEEAKGLSDDIKKINSNIIELSAYAGLSLDRYKEGVNLSNDVDFSNKSMEESKNELDVVESKLKLMDEKTLNNHDLNKVKEINQDYNKYEEMEEEKTKILYNKDENSLEFLKRDYQSYKEKNSRNTIFLSLTTLVYISLLFMSQLILGLPLAIGSIYLIINSKKLRELMRDIQIEMDDMEIKENNEKIKISEIEELQRQLLHKYNIDTKTEFKSLVDKIQIESYRKQESIELYEELKAKRISLIKKIADIESKKDESFKALRVILEQNNSISLNELSKGLDKKSLYEKDIRELETKKDLIKRILGNNTIESLMSEVIDFNIDMNEDIDENQLKDEIDKSNKNISDLKISLRGVEENVNILGKEISRLVEIEEELHEKQIFKEELESQLQSLELAASTIEELSRNIHNQFAPDINKKVSNIVGKITTGKYNNIKISESLNISVENPITKEIIEIHSLSGGTIDQLYFSLRFGIINSMVGDRLPLVLDDCFIQYDDNRLKNIIEFLAEIGNERQVILFTCHNRERKILDKIGADFNLINLT